jgi:hypothetical protein
VLKMDPWSASHGEVLHFCFQLICLQHIPWPWYLHQYLVENILKLSAHFEPLECTKELVFQDFVDYWAIIKTDIDNEKENFLWF